MPRTLTHHREAHATQRVGWLRAAVLGANDGIVSTASLLLGVAAADASRTAILTTGVAAVAAGAFSMAVGEYVSVSSQRDAEQADIAKERGELERFPEHELDELTGIYVDKGLSAELAREVATELSKGDRLAVHMVEELGITEATLARPLQAAVTSALSFAIGAMLPLLAMLAAGGDVRIVATAVVSTIALGLLGATGARLGGAAIRPATVRVVLGGLGAMALTTFIGRLLGTAVG